MTENFEALNTGEWTYTAVFMRNGKYPGTCHRQIVMPHMIKKINMQTMLESIAI